MCRNIRTLHNVAPPATEDEIRAHLNASPGFLGPVSPAKPIFVVADRSVAAMADFVVGANENGAHLAGVNWGRDLPEPDLVADIRNVVEGDPSRPQVKVLYGTTWSDTCTGASNGSPTVFTCLFTGAGNPAVSSVTTNQVVGVDTVNP